MHRLLQTHRLASNLQLQRTARAPSSPRPVCRVCFIRSPYSYLHTQAHALLATPKLPRPSILSPTIKSFLPRLRQPQSLRSYDSPPPASSSPSIVYATIGLSCIVFLYQTHAWTERDERRNPGPALFCEQNLVNSLENWRKGRWWTVLTSCFNHANLLHLGANMLTLYSFGPLFVSVFGTQSFVLTWITSSIMCGGFSLWWDSKHISKQNKGHRFRRSGEGPVVGGEKRHGGSVGGSGPILGLSTALSLLYPRMTIVLFPLPLPIYLGVFNLLVAGFSGYCMATDSIPVLGHAGHLGGMAGGILSGVLMLWRR